MAKYIYLLRYNNYFNRTIKGYNNATIDGYIADGATLISNIPNCTLWNPGDGVDTVLTSKINMYAIPDYCVVTDEAKNVLNRWFVMEATRIQGGQYRLRLHRDLIADSYSVLMQSPDTYVERGYCDVSNDAIYNSEPFSFSQVKKEQTALYDQSGVSWIVGYISAKNFETQTISGKSSNYTFDWSVRLTASDVRNLPHKPYCIFAMPYESGLRYLDGTTYRTISADASRSIATALSEAFSGAGTLIDIQVLPYFPAQGAIAGGVIDLTGVSQTKNHFRYVDITSDATTSQGKIFFFDDCEFTVELDKSIDTTSIKLGSSSRLYRLTSPNGNGSFEFVAEKMVYQNNAEIGIVANCSYMPYLPYIRVFPKFGRLYGSYLNKDTRGLILNGDFSLPQINDAWSTYQIQNKNYQVMFNRQIDSLDLQNTWAARQDVVNAVTGTFGAAISGATSGTMIGGGVGAVVGGIAGGLTSAAGGALDIYANRQLRGDQRQLAIDQHNMTLENVRALPQSVTKANSWNLDSVFVPYLELYEGTNDEIASFERYLYTYGYTINRYGALIDYKNPNGRTWLQGQLIKIDGIDDDAHYVAALADEVHQGFYIGGE